LGVGDKLSDGLGAGANPEVGEKAALESKEDIREFLMDNTKMVFITAGMGGGTGTGAAPVIASIARDLDILTVGIVTVPFAFEGKKKMKAALAGVDRMKQYCDTVLVILNDKLREIFGNLSISTAFGQADGVLTGAAKSIAEIITVSGHVNVDFEDVKTVMKNAGAAVMGTGEAEGENRAKRAAEAALASPLLNNRDIRGAQKILLSMVSGQEEELSMDELTIISEYIQEQAGDEAEVIFGHGVDATLEKNVRVTVIATGFDSEEEVPMMSKEAVKKPQPQPRKVYDLESSQPVAAPQPEPKPERQTSIEWTIGTRGPEVEPEPEQDDSRFRFTGASEPAPEEAEESVSPEMLADLEGQYEIVDAKPKNEYKSVEQRMDEIEENPPQPFDPSMDNKEYKKQQLLEQARRRVRALRANAERDEDDEIKEKLNMPAYLRRNVKLSEPPHSSEKNVSKYHLNDDNQLTSQNKWLHDNVD